MTCLLMSSKRDASENRTFPHYIIRASVNICFSHLKVVVICQTEYAFRFLFHSQGSTFRSGNACNSMDKQGRLLLLNLNKILKPSTWYWPNFSVDSCNLPCSMLIRVRRTYLREFLTYMMMITEAMDVSVKLSGRSPFQFDVSLIRKETFPDPSRNAINHEFSRISKRLPPSPLVLIKQMSFSFLRGSVLISKFPRRKNKRNNKIQGKRNFRFVAQIAPVF